jgi:hypothetical protein
MIVQIWKAKYTAVLGVSEWRLLFFLSSNESQSLEAFGSRQSAHSRGDKSSRQTMAFSVLLPTDVLEPRRPPAESVVLWI